MRFHVVRSIALLPIILLSILQAPAFALHGDGTAYSVGPANHFLQDMYSADGVEADSDNDGAIENSNNIQAAGGTAEVFSPLGGGVLLRIDGSVGSSSYLQFMKGGAQQWTVGKNGADEFIIDRVGAVNVIRINNARDVGIGNPAAITERLTVNGGISITDDPDSDDDLFDRGYANLNFVNEGQAASISNVMLQNNAVTSAKIQDGTIISADIADGVITTADIDTASFDARYVNEGQVSSISSAMIIDSTIQSVDIADGVIQSVDIADGAISTTDLDLAQLDARYVNEGQVASVSGAMISDSAVGSADIADSSIGSADINSNQVQKRVTGNCAVGNAIRTINSDGTVVCQGAGGGSALTYSTYSDSCSVCAPRATALGAHDFCAVAGINGPGGINTECTVRRNADGTWTMYFRDIDDNDTHECIIICIDGLD